jgi:Zn-dependent peptidase ImmA (M78 family)
LASATTTPLGYLFLDKPPEDRLPIPHFRTVKDESVDDASPDLIETVQTMERRQQWMREFLIDEGEEQLAFVKSSNITEPAKVVADRIRATLGFSEGWASKHSTWKDALRALRASMENAGILVSINGVVGNSNKRKLDVEEFRGFVIVDEYAPLVFVNGADGKAAQMFTLSHELAHVFFGASAAFDLRQLMPSQDKTELACNRVAAEFLVPENALRSVWASVRGNGYPFQTVARQFKVSEIVAARRALDLGLIDEARFFGFYRAYVDEERKKPAPDGGDFYNNQPFKIGDRFARTIVRALREGKVGYSQAYRLTGLYGRTFRAFSEDY